MFPAADIARVCNAVQSKRQLIVDTTSSSGGAIPVAGMPVTTAAVVV